MKSVQRIFKRGAFEQMSGLTIHFHKSEIFLFGDVVHKANIYQEIFTCELKEVPLKYLGVPVSSIRIRNKHWKMVTEEIEKWCGCLQGRLLNIASRVTLVQSCLTNMLLFMISFYPIPVGVKKKGDFYRASLVWQADEDKEISFGLLEHMLSTKRSRGSEIINLELMNKALLAKWFWKLETETGL